MAFESDVTVWLMITVCALIVGSSLTSGYHHGVITGPSQFVKEFYNETSLDRYGTSLSDHGEAWLWAATIAVFCVGRIVGAVLGNRLSKRFGRSRCLIGNNVISIFASILMGSSEAAGSPELLILGRFVIGIHVGVSLTVVPVYLKEVSPHRLLSTITRLHHVMFIAGITVGQIFGFFVFYNEILWPGALGLPALIAVFQTLVLLFCPESPKWLLHEKFAEERAAGALRQLRGVEEVEQEIQSHREDHRNESRIVRARAWEIIFLRDSNWKMPLLMCVLLQAGRQLSGVNVIVFYSTEIFLLAGMTRMQTALASLAWGITFTAVTVFEYYCNLSRYQRRVLLLFPYGVLALTFTGLTLALIFQDQVGWLQWVGLISICTFFGAFALGPAVITSVVCSELWSVGPRKAALSVSQQVNWWTDVMVQFMFPVLLVDIGAYTFAIFAGSLILTTLFLVLYLPETKNRRFVEISTGFEALKCGPVDMEDSRCEDVYSPVSLTNR